MSGAFGFGLGKSLSEVLTATKILPLTSSACKDLMLIWSSAYLGPWMAVRLPCHTLSGSPSLWVAKYIASSIWLLHITPIWLSKATTAEMSSELTDVPLTGKTNGVPQV